MRNGRSFRTVAPGPGVGWLGERGKCDALAAVRVRIGGLVPRRRGGPRLGGERPEGPAGQQGRPTSPRPSGRSRSACRPARIAPVPVGSGPTKRSFGILAGAPEAIGFSEPDQARSAFADRSRGGATPCELVDEPDAPSARPSWPPTARGRSLPPTAGTQPLSRSPPGAHFRACGRSRPCPHDVGGRKSIPLGHRGDAVCATPVTEGRAGRQSRGRSAAAPASVGKRSVSAYFTGIETRRRVETPPSRLPPGCRARTNMARSCWCGEVG